MRPTVLIADADELLAAAYRAFLVAEGFSVDWVTTGLACLDLLRERTPEALILDAELPWGGGVGVLEVMARDLGMHSPAAVLLTARPPAIPTLPRGMSTPAMLIKPVSPLAISQTLRALLDSRSIRRMQFHGR